MKRGDTHEFSQFKAQENHCCCNCGHSGGIHGALRPAVRLYLGKGILFESVVLDSLDGTTESVHNIQKHWKSVNDIG